VFHVDVTVAYRGGEKTDRWVQFFDRAFTAGEDYVRLTVADRDKAPRKSRERASERLSKEIEAAYTRLGDAKLEAMAASAFEKAAELSSSRLLRYMYALFSAY
jgi:hypothetical protein